MTANNSASIMEGDKLEIKEDDICFLHSHSAG